MKITYPQILKTGEKVAVRTSASAVFTKQGDTVQDHLNIIDDANLVVLDEEEQTEFNPPESDINDNVISVASTWSSKKINDTIDGLQSTMNFYIPLTETSNDVYSTNITVSEIELAYQAGKAIWVIASEIFLPLRQRVDVNHWIFSGYTDTQAYDIQISNTGVTITYKELVTTNDTLPNPSVLKLTGAVTAVYDGSTEVEVEIPTGGDVPLENGMSKNSIQQANNVAGSMGFKVIATTDNGDGTGSYTLRTVEGLAIGMKYVSVLNTANYVGGTISAINSSTKTITVDGFIYADLNPNADDAENNNIYNYIIIVGRPDLGDVNIGYNVVALGDKNTAYSLDSFVTGRNNNGLGKYVTIHGTNNQGGHNAFVIGNSNDGAGNSTFTGGMFNKNYGDVNLLFGENLTSWRGAGYNIVGGRHCTVESSNNAVFGSVNKAGTGGCNLVFGKNNSINYGLNSLMGGEHCYADKQSTRNVLIGGYSSTANNRNAIVWGQRLVAVAENQAVFGRYNLKNSDALFQIGNGTSDNDHSNAFEVISTDDGVSIKVGNTTLTESQLQQLLAILTNNLAEGEY